MSHSRALRAVGGAVLAGALLFGIAPTASADEIRDRQWANKSLGLEKAWQESTGKGVTVAVIDNGVDGDHPDLQRNVLEGRSYVGGVANKEKKGNHGTAMASLIAGHGHGPGNSQGVVGIAPDAKILPLKTSEDDAEVGEGVPFAEPLKYAVDQGAKVVNMSFGSRSKLDPAEQVAIAYAIEKDVLLVAASGNDGWDKISYPAAEPGVLAVGATDEAMKIWEKSDYGSHVMLTAPGVGIETAGVTEPYRRTAGTSDSTAYVSGLAALVRAKYPDLTAGQVANRLVKTAANPNAEATEGNPDPRYGYGTIRPYEALTAEVPAGPELGPLKEPVMADPANIPPSLRDYQADEGESDDSWIMLAVINVTILLLVVITVILLLVRVRKKRRERRLEAARQNQNQAGYGYPQPGYGAHPHAAPQPFPHQQHPQPGHGAYPPPAQGPPQ